MIDGPWEMTEIEHTSLCVCELCELFIVPYSVLVYIVGEQLRRENITDSRLFPDLYAPSVCRGLESQNRLTKCVIPVHGGKPTVPLWSVGIYAFVWAESQEGDFILLVQ